MRRRGVSLLPRGICGVPDGEHPRGHGFQCEDWFER